MRISDWSSDVCSSDLTVAKESFASGGERSTFYVAILLLALSTISIGNGFFKPNVSTMVGELYEKGDRRRDSGFTIFYMISEDSRVGKECVSTCNCRWAPYHYKTKTKPNNAKG